jgi:hypothetical protein
MAKATSGAKKKSADKKSSKSSLVKSASKAVTKAAPKVAVAGKGEKARPQAKAAKPAPKPASKPVLAKPAGAAKGPEKPAPKPAADKAPLKAVEKLDKAPEKGKKSAALVPLKGKGKEGKAEERAPRVVSKLPPLGQPLTKREMEQLLTAGAGRGVAGEGSLKGKLLVKDNIPNLHVVGRDKRELIFALQGPHEEALTEFVEFVEHKVSVSGFIRKLTNYSGSVDVRKYSAKKPDAEGTAPSVPEVKLQYLSPGEIEQLCSAGMGAGMRGFATMRGTLEMTGDEFFLVLSGAGTRQQVSFNLEGKNAKGLRKLVGQTVQVTGVAEKTSGWGGRLEVEGCEPRPAESRPISRDAMEIVNIEGLDTTDRLGAEVKMNQGLAVKLTERPGFIWAIEPTMAKRVGLREANFLPSSGGAATREFFFTPRNPGTFDIEFFLAKAFTPAQVSKSVVLGLVVHPG